MAKDSGMETDALGTDFTLTVTGTFDSIVANAGPAK